MLRTTEIKAQLISIDDSLASFDELDQHLTDVLAKEDSAQVINVDGVDVDVKMADIVPNNIMKGILVKFSDELREAMLTKKIRLEEELDELT